MSFRWCSQNEGGYCTKCGCSIWDHSYAKIEYITEQTETAAYRALKEQITLAQINISGVEKTVRKEETELEKYSAEIENQHKIV